MGAVTLFTGGSRSGKSAMALKHASGISDKACFVATCVPHDDEMKNRIEKHRNERPPHWHVIEEPIDLAGAIKNIDSNRYPVVLVDCLTLWVCNLMCKEISPVVTEESMALEAQKLADAASQFQGDVILVTNEVGMGIIPANPMARTYADLAGRCNQTIAKNADKVIFVSCGLGITLK